MPQNILVVDDDLTLRRLFAHTLEDEGFHVRQACDGADALAAVAHETPDLVVLDLQMPRLNGVQFLNALETRRLRRFPVIVVSGNVGALSVAPLVEAVLQKPVDLDVLVRRVSHVLEVARERAVAVASHAAPGGNGLRSF